MANKRSHATLNTPAPEDDDPIDPSDELTFIALGGGNEVGRSCHILQYKGKTVMLDAGIHPAYDGLAALPFYDEFDLSTVDVLLVTHFHMDHAASLPYVLAKTNFAGRVYMTHPTKAIYKYLMQDSVRVQNTHISTSANGGTDGYVNQLFNETDVLSTLPMIQTISFNTTHVHNGIRFTPYPAGHVLGACMYLVEIADLNILFTGDYSREHDRHLIPATIPKGLKVDCLITESTFGISSHVPRLERETALMKSITTILNRGGRALLPVFAIGRAQELLLILEDYWSRHPEYQQYPIYYASSLARKCMSVYASYPESMNANITQHASTGKKQGAWDFEYIRSLKSLERFDDVGGCVMLASPGMLQNGVSRSLLERWAPEARNGVVITGYSVEGTMAKQIVLEPDTITAVMTNRGNNHNGGAMMGKRIGGGGMQDEKVQIPRRCTVQEFSFAAHVDGSENREFIEEVGAPVVILVHGEKHNMGRLKSRLLSLQTMKVFSPANCEVLKVPFRREKIARVVGRLAAEIAAPGGLSISAPLGSVSDDDGDGDEKVVGKAEERLMSGVLVQNDFKLSLMAPEDLKEFAGLSTTTIFCRQRITLAAAGVELVRWALEGTFGTVAVVPADGAKEEEQSGDPGGETEVEGGGTVVMDVMGGAVRVVHHADTGEVEMEWEGNVTNDSIADAVMAVLLSVESSPAAVRQSSKLHSHSHNHDKGDDHGAVYDPFGDELTEDNKEEPETNGFGPIKNGSEAKLTQRKHPLADVSPSERLSRVFMFLEAQFGEDAISPIARPRLSSSSTDTNEPVDEITQQKLEAAELARLHGLGIPIPGIEIRVDKSVVRVWLEGLEVEGGNRTLSDRVRAVVERGVETVAPLWR
ncbi:hypothetical protein LTR62_004928 [Meristemomyces frigidus]|uniref:Uncharacterized protein n=1 Tax=Meristemomyces frigidus TaxID=1508187 RepID=A0AAN7TH70_9PEZI|nr:hypothetical protein LTR62_004928 [Meristemomyces frigidus]